MQQDIKYTLTTVSGLQDDAPVGNFGLQDSRAAQKLISSLCLAGLRLVRIVIGGICKCGSYFWYFSLGLLTPWENVQSPQGKKVV